MSRRAFWFENGQVDERRDAARSIFSENTISELSDPGPDDCRDWDSISASW